MYALLTSTPSAGTLKWALNTTAPIAAAAAFSQDMNTLYFQSDLLYALDVKDGRILWSLQISYFSPWMPPLVGPDHTIYAASGQPSFQGIAAVYGTGPNTGKVKFTLPISSGGTALDADGMLYTIDMSTTSLEAYYTYGPYAGKMDWSYNYGSSAASTSPIIVNSTLIVGTWNNALLGICTQESCASQHLWSLQLPSGASSHLFSAGIASADGSFMLVGSLDYSVYCIALT